LESLVRILKRSEKMLEKYRQDIYKCSACGFCRESYTDYRNIFLVCPVREKLKWVSHTLRGLASIGRGILDGKLTYTEKLVKHIYADLHCGLCSTICGSGIDIYGLVEAMRSDIVEKGLELPNGVEALLKGLRVGGHNIFGKPADERAAWADGVAISPKADLFYFVGCMASYKYPSIARNTGKILNQLGVEFNILGKNEWCCGYRALVAGERKLWKGMAMHNYKALKTAGAKRVLLTCAEGYYNFKYEYPKIIEDFDLEVIHAADFLSAYYQKGAIKFKDLIGDTVTYHDPCVLRGCDLFDKPRALLTGIPGTKLVEMKRNKQAAWCCGSGKGITRATDSVLSLGIAGDRIEEAKNIQAGSIITSCPACKEVMEEQNGSTTEKSVRIYDLVEVVAQAMGLHS
jgi:Fe-S oxidoreductase